MNHWKCNECGDVKPFKGLCRDCTVYDDNQKIIEPFHRIRVDKEGNELVSQPRRFESQSMALLKQQFIQPTKKQMAKLEAEKKMREDIQALAENPNDEGIIEIGESATEEE